MKPQYPKQDRNGDGRGRKHQGRKNERERWNWIGHVLRKDPIDDRAVGLLSMPARRRKRVA